MIPEQIFKKTLQAVAVAANINTRLILSRERTPGVAGARFIIATLMRLQLPALSSRDIAQFLNRKQSSINHMWRKHAIYFENDPVYRKIYDSAEKQLTK